jgi:hypothetical protein
VNRTELVTRIVFFDQIAARAKEAAQALRNDLTADARAEFEEQGTAPTWRIPEVATVATAVTHEAPGLADEAAFVAWVRERYPTEVETVHRARPAWMAPFLASLAASGDDAVDTSTGEVVPGITMRPGGNFAGVSIRPTAQGKAIIGAVAGAALEKVTASGFAIAELESADA